MRTLETIGTMWFPLLVLAVAGLLTLAVAWWACLVSEGKDDWMLGDHE
jgi:hypothetical protein